MRGMTLFAAVGSMVASLTLSAMDADAMFPKGCRRMCEKIIDNADHPVAQSGHLYNEYQRCMNQCDRLEVIQNIFRRCIAAAQDEADKQRCRTQYNKERLKLDL